MKGPAPIGGSRLWTYKPEEIVAKLRQVDLLLAQGKALGESIKTIGVTNTTYHR